MYIPYNPNPTKRSVGDCAVRAIAKALDTDWETAYAILAAAGFQRGDMPSSDNVWGSVLREHGFVRETVPNTCPDCYTAADFIRDHPTGVHTLAFGGHVATVDYGRLFDSWDSSDLPVIYYWRKEENDA